MSIRVLLAALLAVAGTDAAVHAQAAGGGSLQTSASSRDDRRSDEYIDPRGGISLDEAVVQALAGEPSLRGARTDVDVAEGRRVQAGLRPNPAIVFSQQIEPGGTDQQTRLEVQWPLDLFRRGARVRVAERELDAARLATADRERLLAADVRMAYGDVAAAVRDLSVAEELSATVARQLALVEGRVAEGATPRLERDLLAVELQRIDADRVLQAGQVEQAMLALERLLGMAPDAALRIRATLEELVQQETQTQTADTARRPDVQEARARVEEAEARVELARSEGRFDVSLLGMYMRMDAGFPQQAFSPDGHIERVRGVFHNAGAGAMVTIPLFDRSQGEVLAARARRAGAAARLEATDLDAQVELASAVARDEYARRAAALFSSDARTLARQTLDVVGQTYELGRATVFDVLAEQRRFLELERDYTRVLREVYQARQALRRARGDIR